MSYLFLRRLRIATTEITVGALLLYLSIPLLGEGWQLIRHQPYAQTEINVHVFRASFESVVWVIHDIGYQLILVAFASIALIWGWPMRSRRIVGFAMLTFALLDTLFYFIDYKRWEHYWIVYACMWSAELAGWVMYFRYKDINSQKK